MWRLPLWTAKVRPTKSGVMVERRDQVLIAGGRLAPPRISSTFFSRCRSMNGPFFTERAMSFRFAPLQRDEGGGMRDERTAVSHPALLIPHPLFNSPVAHDHLRGALVLAGLVAARRLPPGRNGVPTATGLSFAAAVRVVNGVHGYAADVGPDAVPARAPGLAVRDIFVLDVADLTDGRVADDRHAPNLARRHTHLSVVSLLRNQLREAASRAHQLSALARPEFDVVNLRPQRNVSDRQRVSGKDVRLRAAHHGLADFESSGRDDVSLLAVEVRHERDVRRTIRVVLDLRDATGHARLVALEVNDSVEALVAAAATADCDVAVVVAPRYARLRLKQRLLRLRAGRQLVARQISLVAARRRCRCQFLDAHNFT